MIYQQHRGISPKLYLFAPSPPAPLPRRVAGQKPNTETRRHKHSKGITQRLETRAIPSQILLCAFVSLCVEVLSATSWQSGTNTFIYQQHRGISPKLHLFAPSPPPPLPRRVAGQKPNTETRRHKAQQGNHTKAGNTCHSFSNSSLCLCVSVLKSSPRHRGRAALTYYLSTTSWDIPKATFVSGLFSVRSWDIPRVIF
jgi:hypothetical protein